VKIGLIDVDSHNFPNLPLMKLSAVHKARGDSVEWVRALGIYDVVYKSKIFTHTPDDNRLYYAGIMGMGGTGYGSDGPDLPSSTEYAYPDYSIYPQYLGTAYGFLSRGCPRQCPWCIVSRKEGIKSRAVADLDSFWDGQTNIKLLDPNILACADRMRLLDQLVKSRAYIEFAQGLDIRLADDDVISAINKMRISRLHFAWDNPNEDLTLQFRRFKAAWRGNDYRRLVVYVLTNYNSTHEQDLYRVTTLRELGYSPYVMIYNKPRAPKITRHLQRWTNNRRIHRSVEFKNYDPRRG